MEKCLYNGKEIIASEIAQSYSIEEEIRRAGQERRLFCADKECGQPVIYCRGAIKAPYFRHYESSIKCNYSDFLKKKNLNIDFLTARQEIYETFKKNYEIIDIETKISSKHWCDILLNIDDIMLPIELVDKYMTPRRYRSIREEYKEWNGAEPLFIIISDLDLSKHELETNAIERSQLYENYNTLIRYNPEKQKIAIYYRQQKQHETVLLSKVYPLDLFRPDKLKEIKTMLINENEKETEATVAIAEKTVTIEPTVKTIHSQHSDKKHLSKPSSKGKSRVQIFYENHSDLYPLKQNDCSKFFYMYFSNAGNTVHKRIFAANVIEAGWYCDKESRDCINGYVNYQLLNKPSFYKKIAHQFPYLIKGD